MDPDVARLVREQRLLEAARLASAQGDAHGASILFEQACEWRSAASEAMRAGEAARALELATQGGDEPMAEQALALLVRDATAAEAVAARFANRGQHAWAARVLEACEHELEAARAWERAGEGKRAASLLERAGELGAAERVLQAALRREPDAWGVAVSLGALLGRFRQWEAAVRVLQRVPASAPQRFEAVVHMAEAFEQLGFTHAASNAKAELISLGTPSLRPSDAPVTTPAPLPRARLFGRYDLVREVASSAGARVLECADVVLDRPVAIKLFAGWDAGGSGRDALARFEREVRALKSVDSAHVVPLFDFVREAPAIVLAWMPGGTLEQMLREHGSLAPARAVEIASAVLAALGAAHRLGILHRDVKPANVLFDAAGGARLSDFGVAHLSDVSTTATAGVFGTLAYMSPEQRTGLPATARSDLFAAGIMLQEMLTGERPNADEAPRVLPSDAHRLLDARHDAAVARLTARDAHQRPADAFEAGAMLAALPWPTQRDVETTASLAETATPARQRTERLQRQPDGTLLDHWTGRTIEQVRLTEASLRRARAFALADHPGLQTVLRVDGAGAAIWLEALGPHKPDHPLLPEERRRLEGALDALHAAGAVHGRVDASHVFVGPGGAALRFDADPD